LGLGFGIKRAPKHRALFSPQEAKSASMKESRFGLHCTTKDEVGLHMKRNQVEKRIREAIRIQHIDFLGTYSNKTLNRKKTFANEW